jgi:hypothetical protein
MQIDVSTLAPVAPDAILFCCFYVYLKCKCSMEKDLGIHQWSVKPSDANVIV